jgi:putative colanic acid biosynthesis UDP-glucose lipid carrier transferase
VSLSDLPDNTANDLGGTVERFPLRALPQSSATTSGQPRSVWLRAEAVGALLLLVDVAWIIIAGLGTRLAEIGIMAPATMPFDPSASIAFGGTLALMSGITLGLTGSYRTAIVQATRLEAWPTIAGLALSFGFVELMVTALDRHGAVPRLWLGAWLVVSVSGALVARKVLQSTMRALAAEGSLRRRVVVLLAGPHGDAVLTTLRQSRDDIDVIGVFEDESAGRTSEAQSYRAIHELIAFVQNHECDEVVVAVAATEHARIRRIVETLSILPCEVSVCPSLVSLPVPHVAISDLGRLLTLRVQKRPLEGIRLIVKGVMDRVVAAVALVLLAPLFAILAVAIKVGSAGPVFFRQKRHGYNHRIIRVYKFRTMSVMEDGPVVRQARADDDRITPIGRILRKTSLDELPQLINVLMGEMSLVGPRPHAIAHNEQYGALIERYANRHRVKPGITGWAQVNGCRGETRDVAQMRKRIDYDLHYIDNVSILFDLKIMLKTIWVVLSGRNAH